MSHSLFKKIKESGMFINSLFLENDCLFSPISLDCNAESYGNTYADHSNTNFAINDFKVKHPSQNFLYVKVHSVTKSSFNTSKYYSKVFCRMWRQSKRIKSPPIFANNFKQNNFNKTNLFNLFGCGIYSKI